jgi:hypothetical protein
MTEDQHQDEYNQPVSELALFPVLALNICVEEGIENGNKPRPVLGSPCQK